MNKKELPIKQTNLANFPLFSEEEFLSLLQGIQSDLRSFDEIENDILLKTPELTTLPE